MVGGRQGRHPISGNLDGSVHDGPIETLDKSFCSRRADPRPAVLDFIQFQIQLIGVTLRTAKLSAVFREDGRARESRFSIKGNTSCAGPPRPPPSVCSCAGSLVRIQRDVQMHPAHTLQAAAVERVLAEQLPGPGTLRIPLPEGWVLLLNERHKFARQFDGIADALLVKLQPAVVPAGPAVLDEDVLDRGGADRHARQIKLVREPYAAPGRVSQAHLNELRGPSSGAWDETSEWAADP